MDFTKLADEKIVAETVEALKKRNIEVFVVNTKEEAFRKLISLIPNGVDIMTGASETLRQIGFTDFLKSGKYPWKNLKDEIVNEKDPEKQKELRRKAILATYFIGSVHAITEDGQVLVASASGSQISSYAYSSPHVIWVAGTQKIVSDFNTGIKRIENYVFPLEDKRMKSLGFPGSSINEILTIRKSFQGRIAIILVKEALGF